MNFTRGVSLAAAACWLLAAVLAEPAHFDPASLLYLANISYAGENKSPSTLASIFSPRMDFEQWKPLTGRGDPLRNDPTYDYEPPVLERVRYWADETRYEREHYPERKSEVLMLGVSSRRPSAASRPPPPPPPPRRPHRPPPPISHTKYDEYSYKGNERYPMTILVPPPPPPPGHQLPLFVLDDTLPLPTNPVKFTETPTLAVRETTSLPERITSSYAIQESNLIYQSSSTANQNWVIDTNKTNTPPIKLVSSDYAGWGPTTPLDEIEENDRNNFIFKDHNEYKNSFGLHPYSFYKPMLSESPPPPKKPQNIMMRHTFLPTAIPPTTTTTNSPTTSTTTAPVSVTVPVTYPQDQTTFEVISEPSDLNSETETEKDFTATISPTLSSVTTFKPDNGIFDMMASMLSMPLVNGPERPEDHLYAHASENQHVFKEKPTKDANIETMQTMLPPPTSTHTESSTVMTQKRPFHENANLINHLAHQTLHTHDPYLHMRFTTPKPKTVTSSPAIPQSETVPTYLIIQGHSKVKTYSSKPKNFTNRTLSNEIPKPNETDEVKHLHPLKEKQFKKTEKSSSHRASRAHNLRSLVDTGLGSIEIQETDIGIKYDVSDGSDVPAELYRKGIVESDENDYASSKKGKRSKRQISLEDLVPIDEDTLEEYVYNFLDRRRNATGITGLIAQAVTGNAVDFADDLEDDNDEEDDR